MNHTYKYLMEEFDIDEKVLQLVAEAEEEVRSEFEHLDDIMAYNQYKVLKAFQKNRIREMHFGWKTGYGYDDAGRDALGQTFAEIDPETKNSMSHRARALETTKKWLLDQNA